MAAAYPPGIIHQAVKASCARQEAVQDPIATRRNAHPVPGAAQDPTILPIPPLAPALVASAITLTEFRQPPTPSHLLITLALLFIVFIILLT